MAAWPGLSPVLRRLLDRVLAPFSARGVADLSSWPESAVESRGFAASVNRFGLDVYQRIQGAQGNLAFSPASLASGLVMAYAGARATTAEQMRATLRLAEPLEAVTSEAGRLMASLGDPRSRPEPFHLPARQVKSVPTMHMLDTLGFVQRRGLRALELPYRGRRLSMLVLLPDAVEGLGSLEEALTGPRLEAIVRSLAPTLVQVSLPRFEINPSRSLELAGVLAGFGMTDAFDRERADFTGLANPPDPGDRLFISKVFHKTFVKSDEKGTEAAAATALEDVVLGLPSRPVPDPAVFKADHPFLFFIRDVASGLVVFMGRVADPSER